MTIILTLLRLAGLLQLLLAASHVLFVRPLNWREETRRLSPVNRAVFWAHTLFIVLVLTMLGTLALLFAPLLVAPDPLARVILTGHVVFWGCRLAAQFLLYRPALWRGDRFRTAVHGIFTCLWTYLTITYAAALVAACLHA